MVIGWKIIKEELSFNPNATVKDVIEVLSKKHGERFKHFLINKETFVNG